jgi:hypothetical protein
LRAEGLRVVIFTDDHTPAHVHVFGDRQAKMNVHGAETWTPAQVRVGS